MLWASGVRPARALTRGRLVRRIGVQRCDLRVGQYVFFFQAEDGIRDVAVTGVQTCALPILLEKRDRLVLGPSVKTAPRTPRWGRRSPKRYAWIWRSRRWCDCWTGRRWERRSVEIGRASWRERVEISVVAVSLKKKKSRSRER